MIATEKGWNVYVGGNGGFTPRHAQLFAEDLSTDDLVRTIDRFLMYYVRTADRLQRTAAWVEDHEGGLEAIADVVIDDSLGIGADLDAAMATHVDSYVDEWAATLADPEKRAQFVSFVNAPETPDDGVGGAIDNRRHDHRRPDAGGTPMTIAADAHRTWTRVCSLDQLIPERGIAALVGSDPVARVPARRRHRARRRPPRPVQQRQRDGPRHRRQRRCRATATATPWPRRCTSRSSTSPPASA